MSWARLGGFRVLSLRVWGLGFIGFSRAVLRINRTKVVLTPPDVQSLLNLRVVFCTLRFQTFRNQRVWDLEVQGFRV